MQTRLFRHNIGYYLRVQIKSGNKGVVEVLNNKDDLGNNIITNEFPIQDMENYLRRIEATDFEEVHSAELNPQAERVIQEMQQQPDESRYQYFLRIANERIEVLTTKLEKLTEQQSIENIDPAYGRYHVLMKDLMGNVLELRGLQELVNYYLDSPVDKDEVNERKA